MTSSDAYKELLKRIEDILLLVSASAQLGWDLETYMPPKGIELRSRQLALLSTLSHEQIIDPENGKLIKAIKENPEFSKSPPLMRRNVHLFERRYTLETCRPKELVAQLAKQRAITYMAWKTAKKESNYALFKPEFAKMVDLVKENAEALDSTKEPFECLMDAFYEPGMTCARLDLWFEHLKKALIPLIEQCISSPHQPNIAMLHRKCPIETQREISEDIARIVGYDFEAGRIDETEHPFTTGFSGDVRITTKYEANFAASFFTVLHESGHGIYEQSIREEYALQPVSYLTSTGLHESQSLFLENFIGRSQEFWRFYLPQLKHHTGSLFEDVNLERMYSAVNQVALTPIRVMADELTYAFHIIIRYELERDLLADKIDLDDLPGVWNEKISQYLKIDIQNDAEGVLQDVHWSQGMFGYFPSYELGYIYAAQLLAAIAKDIPDYKSQLTQGSFTALNQWLNEKIRRHGDMYNADELIERATGEKLTVDYLINYLTQKYTDLYQL
ncbi:MAG: carboxypeptidase M32 [Candidatus Heimdallarchaeota archaeon]